MLLAEEHFIFLVIGTLNDFWKAKKTLVYCLKGYVNLIIPSTYHCPSTKVHNPPELLIFRILNEV